MSRPNQQTDETMKLTDAAEALGVSDRTIRRRMADGSLPAFRVGPRLLRVRRSDVEALLVPLPSAATTGK